jgi:hypothetical protein
MRLKLIIAVAIFLAIGEAVAQQRQLPERKPSPPATAQQPPSPSAAQGQQPNQGELANPQQNRETEQRGTEDNPAIVKILPAEKSAAERAEQERDRRQKESTDQWVVRLTLALVAVGVLQFLALIGQAIVFGMQARRLRQSVDLTRTVANRQEQDMAASITQAARAATAMEGVADAMTQNVANTRELLERQREFAIMQMRAYIFVQTGDILNVADPPHPIPADQPLPKGALTRADCGPIIVMTVRNAGHTPANNVVHVQNSVFREFPLTAPLPDFVEIPPDQDVVSVFSLAPGGVLTKNWVYPTRFTAEEVERLRNATAAIYVYGRITYTDIFGIERTTDYRYRHNAQSGIVGISGELTAARQGNDST